MKVYWQSDEHYWVFNFGRFSFRVGYTEPTDIGVFRYVSENMTVLSLWLFGLFLQVDWTEDSS